MSGKQTDVMAILKLYELRRDELMREARKWFFTEFQPASGLDIVKLLLSGQAESANYRMVSSYWDMAASFVLNGGIDEKLFLGANTEHIGVYAKLQPYLAEVREIIKEPDYHANLEQLVLKIPNIEEVLENRRKLFERWAKNNS